MEMKPVERWRSNLASGLSGGLTEIMESVVGGLAREELIRGVLIHVFTRVASSAGKGHGSCFSTTPSSMLPIDI
jgi:hypothetical protein